MTDLTNKAILLDLHGRTAVTERYVEGLLAQHREWLTRFAQIEAQQAVLLGHARKMADHVRRLVNEKDQVAATFGRMAFDLHNAREGNR